MHTFTEKTGLILQNDMFCTIQNLRDLRQQGGNNFTYSHEKAEKLSFLSFHDS